MSANLKESDPSNDGKTDTQIAYGRSTVKLRGKKGGPAWGRLLSTMSVGQNFAVTARNN
jgi:hypothetical protein